MREEYEAKIRSRIVALQRELIHQKEQNDCLVLQNQEQWKEVFLQVIDVIDLIEQLEKIEANKYQQKIKKRLLSLLTNHDVLRIDTQDGHVLPELTKVVGTKAVDCKPVGNIVEVCRYGYIWKDTVVRPVEIIVACSLAP